MSVPKVRYTFWAYEGRTVQGRHLTYRRRVGHAFEKGKERATVVPLGPWRRFSGPVCES